MNQGGRFAGTGFLHARIGRDEQAGTVAGHWR
jgi:hypothetical protein